MKRTLVSAALLVSLAACGDNKVCAELRSQVDAIDDTIDTIGPGPVAGSLLARAYALTAQMEELGCES